jgi:hypothetical protein
MPKTPVTPAIRAHALHARTARARVTPGAPSRCPLPAALETFGFPAVPVAAVRGFRDAQAAA